MGVHSNTDSVCVTDRRLWWIKLQRVGRDYCYKNGQKGLFMAGKYRVKKGVRSSSEQKPNAHVHYARVCHVRVCSFYLYFVCEPSILRNVHTRKRLSLRVKRDRSEDEMKALCAKEPT